MSSQNINNMVRGGQTLDHIIGMAKQVISKVLTLGGSAFFGMIIFYYVTVDEKVYFKNFVNYSMAYTVASFNEDPSKNAMYITDFPKYKMLRSGNIYNNKDVNIQKDIFITHLKKASSWGGILFAIVMIFTFGFINRYGKNIKKDEHLRGSIVGDVNTTLESIKQLVKKDSYLSFGSLILAKLKIPFQWEPQHFSLVGGSGTGKSVIYGYFIRAIRKSKKRAIIHDRSGTYVEKYYDPKTDIILNPFDIRTSPWSLFGECKTSYHFEHVSEVLFPESKGDPFWYLAPRLVFTAMSIQESESNNPSTKGLIDRVMRCTLKEMIDICKGTDAMTILDKDGVKLAQTIRSIIATNVRHFRVFDSNNDNVFSIRDWLKDDTKSGFVFITSDKEKDVILKPIITLWLDISVATILSMSEKLDRRIWFLLDELQALGRLVSLPVALAESRKYGGCFVLGFQGYSQACMIYTKDGIEALMDCVSTFIFTRCNGANTSEWAEKQLGKAEQIESNETLSYGIKDVRDSQGQNKNRQNRSVVLASELQNLPDLHSYIRFGRGVPITKVAFPFVKQKKLHEGIIDSEEVIENVALIEQAEDEVEEVIDEVEENKSSDVIADTDSQMDSTSLTQEEKPEERKSIYNMDFDSIAIEDSNSPSNNFDAIPSSKPVGDVSFDDEFDVSGGMEFEED